MKVDIFSHQIVILVGFIIIFYLVKPSLTFKPDGKLREFGVGYSKDGYRKTFLTLFNIILILTVYLEQT